MLELKDTAAAMCSSLYKDRFFAEYHQLRTRYLKLQKMTNDWDAGILNFTPTCPREVYDRQLKAMEDYMRVLEERSVMEGVELRPMEHPTKRNTVTQEQVDENMKDVIVRTVEEFGKPTTYVTIRMKNGFTLRESTTCVDPANYDENIGKEICLKRLESKVWYLLGYALQERLYNTPTC